MDAMNMYMCRIIIYTATSQKHVFSQATLAWHIAEELEIPQHSLLIVLPGKSVLVLNTRAGCGDHPPRLSRVSVDWAAKYPPTPC